MRRRHYWGVHDYETGRDLGGEPTPALRRAGRVSLAKPCPGGWDLHEGEMFEALPRSVRLVEVVRVPVIELGSRQHRYGGK